MRHKKQVLKRLTGVILTLAAIYGFTANTLIAAPCDFSSKELDEGCDHKITNGRIGMTSQKITSVTFHRDISDQMQLDRKMHTYRVTISTDSAIMSNRFSKNQFNATLFWVKAENAKLNKQVETLGNVYHNLGYIGGKPYEKIQILSHINLPCLGNKTRNCFAYYVMDQTGFDISKQTHINFNDSPGKIIKILIEASKAWGKEAEIQLLAELVHFARVTLGNMKIEPGNTIQVPVLFFSKPNGKTEFNFDKRVPLTRNPQGLFTIPWLTQSRYESKESEESDSKEDMVDTEIENDFRYKLLRVIRILHNGIIKKNPIQTYLPREMYPLLEAANGHLSAEGHESEFAFNVPMMLIQYNLSQSHNVVYAYEAQAGGKENASSEANKVMMELIKQRTKGGLKTSNAIHSLTLLWSQHFRERWEAMEKTRTKIIKIHSPKSSNGKLLGKKHIQFYALAGGLLAELLLGNGAIFSLGDIKDELVDTKSRGEAPDRPLYKNWEKHLSNTIDVVKKTKSKLVLRMGGAHALSAQDYVLAKGIPSAKNLAQGSHKDAFNNLTVLNESGIKTVALCAIAPKYFPHLWQRLDQSNNLFSVKFITSKASSFLMYECYSPYTTLNKVQDFYGRSKSIQTIIPEKYIGIFKEAKLDKEIKEWVPGKWDK
ncbi:MAG: hypothetical protein GY754_15815 [bacterium]|nr:hypothetical protein [bacterium]